MQVWTMLVSFGIDGLLAEPAGVTGKQFRRDIQSIAFALCQPGCTQRCKGEVSNDPAIARGWR